MAVVPGTLAAFKGTFNLKSREMLYFSIIFIEKIALIIFEKLLFQIASEDFKKIIFWVLQSETINYLAVIHDNFFSNPFL